MEEIKWSINLPRYLTVFFDYTARVSRLGLCGFYDGWTVGFASYGDCVGRCA
jgi:hypothetical protein